MISLAIRECVRLCRGFGIMVLFMLPRAPGASAEENLKRFNFRPTASYAYDINDQGETLTLDGVTRADGTIVRYDSFDFSNLCQTPRSIQSFWPVKINNRSEVVGMIRCDKHTSDTGLAVLLRLDKTIVNLGGESGYDWAEFQIGEVLDLNDRGQILLAGIVRSVNGVERDIDPDTSYTAYQFQFFILSPTDEGVGYQYSVRPLGEAGSWGFLDTGKWAVKTRGVLNIHGDAAIQVRSARPGFSGAGLDGYDPTQDERKDYLYFRNDEGATIQRLVGWDPNFAQLEGLTDDRELLPQRGPIRLVNIETGAPEVFRFQDRVAWGNAFSISKDGWIAYMPNEGWGSVLLHRSGKSIIMSQVSHLPKNHFPLMTMEVSRDGRVFGVYQLGSSVWSRKLAGTFVSELLGDMNCDGKVDRLDRAPFSMAIYNLEKYKQRYPRCASRRADINDDGQIDRRDGLLMGQLLCEEPLF